MKVAIVGTGYVGLVSGVCLAAKGHDVVCVDVNLSIVDRLNAAEPTIYEVGLPDLLRKVRDEGRFRATNQLDEALDGSEIVIIAVGTPSDDGVIDLTYIRQVSRQIGSYLKTANRHISVVIKSTVVPGTTDTVVRNELEAASGLKHPAFGLGMNPEFLREGEAIEDFAEPDRIVLGHEDPLTLSRLEALYAPWNVDKVCVNTRTAEMIKYANNALLATQISAVNEIANLSAALGGIDVLDVVKAVHLDKRWNPIIDGGKRVNPNVLTYLVPGCGFGGSCFPKDVQALRSQGTQQGLPMRVLNAVLDVNEAQPSQVLDIIQRDLPIIEGKRALVLGLAFKPGTDDVRESASLKIVEQLIAKGAHVVAHDPIATLHFGRALGDSAKFVRFVEAWQDEVGSADIIIVATKWPVYSQLTTHDLSGKKLFDARRMFLPHACGGADYLSIGRRVA